MSEYNYEQDIQLDPNALDEEWLGQPALFLKYSAAEAQARKELDELKQALDVQKAQTELAIRSDPESYGLTKATEATVNAALLADEDIQSAQAEVREARYNLDVMIAAVRAMDHRRKALEGLVTLHSQGYFSTPSTRGMGEAGREKVASIEKEGANQKIKRRRRKPVDEEE